MRGVVLIVFISILFLSCEKKELPVPKYVPPPVIIDTTGNDSTNSTLGQLITSQVDMGNDYRTQIWFSLGENKIVYSNLKFDWDLMFEANENGSHIFLNGSKSMKAHKTNFTSLTEVNDTSGIGSLGKADMPSGNMDSTAIGDWQTDNRVYIISRGYNELGKIIGYIKLRITGFTTDGFTFEYADVSSSNIQQGTVTKDPDKNFVAFSFNTNSQVMNLEPKKMEYDLCFTNYTHLFLSPLQYYQVTGVFSNSYKTRVARFTDVPFSSITKKDTLGKVFKTDRNTVGYDWKTFNLNTNIYSIDSKICYIIQDSKGYYYKLRFTDFYNKGVKGSPKFEFQRL